MIAFKRLHSSPAVATILALLGTTGLGCGDAQPDEGTAAGATENLKAIDPALLEGNRISGGAGVPVAEESETTSVVQGSTGFTYTSFNADDVFHVSYPTSTSRQICKGTSLAGYDVRDATGLWRGMQRIVTPPGIAVLWGDPALGYVNNSVFLSQVVSPMDVFNTASGNQNCWTNNKPATSVPMLSGACIFQSTSQTTTANFSNSATCLRTGSDFYDGGSLSGDGGTAIMAAFLNDTQHRIDVWRGPGTYVHLPTPFPGKVMDGHPLILGGYVLVARDSSMNLWVTNFRANNSTWSTPVLVGSGETENVTLTNGMVIRSDGHQAAMGGASGVPSPPTVYVAYMKPSGSFTQIRVVACGFSLQSGDITVCTDQPSLASSPNANALLPSIAVAHPVFGSGPSGLAVRMSFWSEQGLPSGQLQLRSFNFNTPTTVVTSNPQTPCPDGRGYWGDYDDTVVLDDFTSDPSFLRPYTDSTDATCSSVYYNATPQHVSTWNLPLTDFTPVTLQNGWTNAPFATRAAAVGLAGGIVNFRGAIATTGTNNVAFTLPDGYRPTTGVYVPVNLCNSAKGRLFISPSGTVQVFAKNNFSDAQCFTSLEGASFAVSNTTYPFTPLALQNGWVNAPFGTRNAVVGNDNGTIRFAGAVASGSGVLFNVPAGMRPTTVTYVPVDLCSGNGGRLVIQPGGDVTVEEAGGATDFRCFTSLEGANYALYPSTFSPLALQNGWTNGPFGTRAAGARNDKHFIRFVGAISGGSTGIAFTLPNYFRPPVTAYVPVDLCGASNGRLVVSPSGTVTVEAEGGAFNNAQCFTSLEGVSFSL